MESTRHTSRHLEFRNYGDTESELKIKIQALFDNAKKKWEGVFFSPNVTEPFWPLDWRG